MSKEIIKIATVGDVHDLWEDEDNLALVHLGVDLVLFVGDFGNESVEIVRKIAEVNLPKAVILGNHDAWYTASEWGRKKSPYNHKVEDRVQQQLDLLGKFHVGYDFLDFEELELSVVGGRPFSWGGTEWRNKQFYRDRLGINNFEESRGKIVESVAKTRYNQIIFLGHNGPIGLGDQAEDSCGRDWYPLGGDFGDPDLAEAIAATKERKKKVPLVTFGHMHHQLRHSKKLRKMVNKNSQGTIYYNCASVPRIIKKNSEKIRNFSLIVLKNYLVDEIDIIWLGKDFTINKKQVIYRNSL